MVRLREACIGYKGHDMKPSVGQRVLQRLRDFAETLETTDRITDKYTCRTIKLNLKPQRYTAEKVRATRDLLHVSQAVFAQFVGVSVRAVQDWEQGLKPPRGTACRIMDEIRRDPQYWRNRLRQLAEPVER
jgi:putative transcriptional regulator